MIFKLKVLAAFILFFITNSTVWAIDSSRTTNSSRTTIRYSTAFFYSENTYRSIAIVPINSNYYSVGSDGKYHPLPSLRKEASGNITNGLIDMLVSKKYALSDIDSDKLFSEDQEENAHADLYEEFTTISKTISLGSVKQKAHAEISTIGISSGNNPYAQRKDVDAFIVVDFNAYSKDPKLQRTESIKGLAVTFAFAALFDNHTFFTQHIAEEGFLRIGLFDAKNGQLLWANSAYTNRYKDSIPSGSSRTHSVHSPDKTEILINAALLKLPDSNSPKPHRLTSSYRFDGRVYLDSSIDSSLAPHKCGLEGSLNNAFRAQARKHGVSISASKNDVPVVKVKLKKVRGGMFATAKTKSWISGDVYFNGELLGNFENSENINVIEGYRFLCKRIETSIKKTLEPIFDDLDSPNWDPLTGAM